MTTTIITAAIAFLVGYGIGCRKKCKQEGGQEPGDIKASLPPNKDRDTPIGSA